MAGFFQFGLRSIPVIDASIRSCVDLERTTMKYLDNQAAHLINE